MHEVLVNRLGGLSLPKKSVVRLTDRPDMTLDVYRGRKTTNQQINNFLSFSALALRKKGDIFLTVKQAAGQGLFRQCEKYFFFLFQSYLVNFSLRDMSISKIGQW